MAVLYVPCSCQDGVDIDCPTEVVLNDCFVGYRWREGGDK